MADYQVLLVGGPCDQQVKKLSPDAFALGETSCGGETYIYDGITRPTGSLPHFVYRPGSPSPDVKAPKAHKGWQSMRTTFNSKMPAALHSSHRTTAAALRSLAKARKVRL